MALTKEIVVDKVEVLEMGQLQVRTATRVLEDGVQLSSSFHRHVLAPGDDLSEQDAKVSAIATATWTPAVVSAYEAMIAEQLNS
jgi:urease accessory protein UreE